MPTIATAGISGIIIGAIIVFLILGMVLLGLLVSGMLPLTTYIQVYMNGLNVGLGDLIGMNLRGVDSSIIVESMIKGIRSNVDVNVADLEAHYLCEGNISHVVEALIQARQANIPLDFESACAIDLAGRDVLEAVNICIMPIVDNFRATGIAKDGIQIHVNIKVTLKAEIERLIGGATEHTIQARVIQGVISTIGSADKHGDILSSPSIIAERLVEQSLDTGTAFKIISIDIADIDVGNNIGAHLSLSKAAADKKVAQAKAEARRAMAKAMEFVARSNSREMQARLVANQGLVPKALSEAYAKGRLVIERKKKNTKVLQFN